MFHCFPSLLNPSVTPQLLPQPEQPGDVSFAPEAGGSKVRRQRLFCASHSLRQRVPVDVGSCQFDAQAWPRTSSREATDQIFWVADEIHAGPRGPACWPPKCQRRTSLRVRAGSRQAYSPAKDFATAAWCAVGRRNMVSGKGAKRAFTSSGKCARCFSQHIGVHQPVKRRRRVKDKV